MPSVLPHVIPLGNRLIPYGQTIAPIIGLIFPEQTLDAFVFLLIESSDDNGDRDDIDK